MKDPCMTWRECTSEMAYIYSVKVPLYWIENVGIKYWKFHLTILLLKLIWKAKKKE